MTMTQGSSMAENHGFDGPSVKKPASMTAILRAIDAAAVRKTLRAGSLGGMALSLTACGGEDGIVSPTTPTAPTPMPTPPSTGGTTPVAPTTFQGVVIDGYIKSAVVFADANGNGRQDSGEISTITDDFGVYTLPTDAVGRLISVGGVDISTNLPFNGTMTAPQGATVITSLTTLVNSLVSAGQDSATAKATVASVLGLPSGIDINSYDPLLAATDANATAAQRQAALEAHKIAVNVAVILSQTGAIGGVASSAGANTTSTAAADALAALIRGTANGQRLDLTNASTLDAVFNAVGSALGGGDQARLDQVKSQLVTVMLQTTEAIERVPVDASNVINTLNSVAKAQLIAQGGASAAMSQAVQTGNAAPAVAAFTGAALTTAIDAAQPFILANGVQAPITVVTPTMPTPTPPTTPVDPGPGPGPNPEPVNAAPTVIRPATFIDSETITFAVSDADSSTLTVRVGTTAVALGDVVNGKDGATTLKLAAQQATVQGELNVFDGTQSSSLGLFLSLGSAGNDTVTASGNNPAILRGFGGNDVLTGGSGTDTLVGDEGEDTLIGGAGNDTFAYAKLSDLIVNNSVIDSIDGGEGSDIIRVDAAVTITQETDLSRASNVESIVQNATGGARVEINSLTKLGSIRGFDLSSSTGSSTVILDGVSRAVSVSTGSGDDRIVGTLANDVLNGGGGADTISGGAGADTLIGGDGDDVFTYVKLGDFLQGNAAVDSIDGGAGEDRFEISGRITFTAADSLARVTGVETFRQRDIESGPDFSANILIESDEKLGSIRNFDLRGSSLATSVIDLSRITKDVSVRIEAGTNTISGGSGNDVLTSSSGNNVFIGGAGVDTLIGGVNSDSFEYASFTNLFANNAVIDSINGGAGADRIRVNDAITVTAADSFARVVAVETLLQSASGAASVVVSKDENLGSIRSLDLTASTASSTVNLSGVTQAMTVTTGSGNDTINGGSGADALKGGAGDDTFAYAKFSDFFANNAVIDSIDGGEGADSIQVAQAITLTAADSLARVAGVETVTQTATGAASVIIDKDANLGSIRSLDLAASTAASSVTLTSVTQAMMVTTGSSNDTITGGTGIDTLNGGAGNDTFVYAKFSDFVTNNAVIDNIDGGDGADTIQVAETIILTTAGSLARVVGVETLTQTAAGGAIVLINSDANLGSIRSIDLAASTASTNVGLSGVTRALAITAGSGRDEIIGGAGADTINAGAGDDAIVGGDGVDSLNGGAGNDIFEYADFNAFLTNNAVVDSVDGGDGADTIRVAFDAITLTAADSLARVAGVETLTQIATGAASVIIDKDANLGSIRSLDLAASTAASSVTLSGVTQAITVTTGSGNDTIAGGAGADTLFSGAGRDVLSGGAGNDIFVLSTNDFLASAINTPPIFSLVEFLDTIQGGDGADTLSLTITDLTSVLVFSPMSPSSGVFGFSNVSGVETFKVAASSNATGPTGIAFGFNLSQNDPMLLSTGSLRKFDFLESTVSVGVDLGSINNNNLVGASYTVVGGSGSDRLIGANLTGHGNIVDGGAGNDTILGGGGNDTLYGGSGADDITGGAGADYYGLGENDNAIDKVTDNGSQVAISLSAITGFDVVINFGKSQDVLIFQDTVNQVAVQLTGTFDSSTQSFVVGAAPTDNDVIVFNDSNINGIVDADERAIVVANLQAGGQAVDLNGAADGNGYAVAAPAPSLAATTDRLVMTDDVTAKFSLATLIANDTGTNLTITDVSGPTGPIGLVVFDAFSNTVTVISQANTSATSGQIITGSFTYTLSDGTTTTTGTVTVDVFNSTSGADLINVSTGGYQAAYLNGGAGNDTLTGTSGDDTIIGGNGQDSLTGGNGKDVFIFLNQADSPVDPGLINANTGTDKITDFNTADDKVSFGPAGSTLAGTQANYRESIVRGAGGNSDGTGLTGSGFISAADQAHGEGTENGVFYFFGADSTADFGYLSYDADNDNLIDNNYVIVLEGRNALAEFDFLNIV